MSPMVCTIFPNGPAFRGVPPPTTATTQYPLRQLERGIVHDPLWAACQRSLLRHGELHNNVRMTWGKALPFWTADLEQSVAWGQHLNDKYALDGAALLGGRRSVVPRFV